MSPRPTPRPRSRRGSGKPPAQERAPKSWGGVARRGVGPLEGRPATREAPQKGPPPAWEPELWIQEAVPVREQAGRAVRRGGRKAPPPAPEPQQPRRAPPGPERDRQQLDAAAGAFQRERYRDAARMLKPLVERAPESANLRELYGLALYRVGRYQAAIKELEAFARLTASVEQHPVLADSYRAVKRWRQVERLWDELRRASPSAELVTEGRIVAAGALADRGELQDAIRLLEKAPEPKRPKPHHLRLWYALADLWERAGDVPKARGLFGRIQRHDPEFGDVEARLSALGR